MSDTTAALEAIDTFNEDEVTEAYRRLKERRGVLSRRKVRSFRPGDRVTFEGRGGRRVTGTVEKLNRKTVGVQADDGQRWRVAGTLLEPLAD